MTKVLNPMVAPPESAFLSSDVSLNIKLLVQVLHGSMPEMVDVADRPLSYTDALSCRAGVAVSDLYLSCQLHAHGQPLGLPERTCNMPGSRLRWNEWITFRAKYCDLSPDAWVALTLIGSAGPLAARTVGTARLPLFSEAQQLRTGVVTVLLDLSQGGDAVAEAAANGVGEATGEATSGAAGCAADVEEMARLEELAARHEEVTAQADRHLDWLNRPTFVHLEQRQLELSRRIERHLLTVQLPDFEYPVLFHEKVVSLPLLQPQKQASQTPRGGGGGSSSSLTSAGSSGAGGAGGLRAVTEAGARASGWASGLHDSPVSVVLVSDLERPENNPALHKHHKLARSLLSAGFVKELKPDAEERRRLEALVQQPPTTRLREEERELLWKFRYSLTKDKRALTKLLKCVDWADSREVQQAESLVHQWVEVDVQDLLELLGGTFVGAAAWVRAFAVVGLRDRASDEQLLSYLLSLVQALQYERQNNQPPSEGPLASLLIARAVRNPELANFLHWYLLVERNSRHGTHYAHVHDSFLELLKATDPNTVLAFRRQEAFITALSQASASLKASGENRPKRVQRLRAMFDEPSHLGPLKQLDFPLLMPLDPTWRITASMPEKAYVFKSAMQPLGFTFTTVRAGEDTSTAKGAQGGGEYSIIFKSGDDLRQDQLVLQMLQLMDKVLREQGLDLQLTSFRVLATGPGMGLVERVPDCEPLAEILKENRGDIRRYLELKHPSASPLDGADPRKGPGIDPNVLETFVKSCAGYCVTMYLLGVGDRHLDNLMLRSNGALFHIDFGYLFGRDPKPFPPPMKLCKEMVEVMGGADSMWYARFRLLCCEAFNILRAEANLILNLLMLMVDAEIQDLRGEVEVLSVAKKFRLDLNNEEASRHFQELINESVGALFPQLVERLHTLAQWARA